MEENLSVLQQVMLAMKNMSWIEVAAVISGLIYVLLAAREHIACWFFGIINAGLSIYLFYLGKLYAESILYFYYVIAGFYGWWAWAYRKKTSEKSAVILQIHTWSWRQHGQIIIAGILLSVGLAKILSEFTDAQIPILDSFTTIFSFLATYMVTRKILENWLYWIVIDMVTTGMYFYREYYLYALLMIIYTVIAVIGYREWLKRMDDPTEPLNAI